MNQTLDEILQRLVSSAVGLKLSNAQDYKQFVPTAKSTISQAIDEIIGKNDGQLLAPRTMKPYKNDRNRKARVRDNLRAEQHKRKDTWVNGGEG